MIINNLIRSPRIYGGTVHEKLVHASMRKEITQKGRKVMTMEVRVNIEDIPECITTLLTFTAFKKPRFLK